MTLKEGDHIIEKKTGKYIGYIVLYDFYDTGAEDTLCLVTEEEIYPVDEIVWDNYKVA